MDFVDTTILRARNIIWLCLSLLDDINYLHNYQSSLS